MQIISIDETYRNRFLFVTCQNEQYNFALFVFILEKDFKPLSGIRIMATRSLTGFSMRTVEFFITLNHSYLLSFCGEVERIKFPLVCEDQPYRGIIKIHHWS